jgi:hypothetical protein
VIQLEVTTREGLDTQIRWNKIEELPVDYNGPIVEFSIG